MNSTNHQGFNLIIWSVTDGFWLSAEERDIPPPEWKCTCLVEFSYHITSKGLNSHMEINSHPHPKYTRSWYLPSRYKSTNLQDNGFGPHPCNRTRVGGRVGMRTPPSGRIFCRSLRCVGQTYMFRSLGFRSVCTASLSSSSHIWKFRLEFIFKSNFIRISKLKMFENQEYKSIKGVYQI